MEVRITADVNAFFYDVNPTYRIWIDDVLYVERDFWLDWQTYFIREEIFIELEPGAHTLLLEKIRPSGASIWIERFTFEQNTKTTSAECGINPQDKQTIQFNIG